MKMELFDNANVTASSFMPLEHALGSLGITRGYFDYLYLDFEHHSVSVWTGISFHTDKKDAFSKLSRYLWTGPQDLWY